ncbi:protein kinase domain-containing protein [Yinghuangia sp. YIM S09857]|uniref:serine/threonine-protein kinase n=1 Tax=Yinghuangia sp. YIM S09857 TaxID=3436929 RepID=UPI003F530E99
MSERLLAERFELHHELGRGGMGVVWHATDTVLGRSVAVKCLHAPTIQGDPAIREVLVREARAAARLNHPGAVTVHDVVRDGADVYIVMEYVPAPTLAAVVDAHGPLSADRVAAIGRRLAEVVGAAHALGIVHRDIKPENVMLLPGDRVKLTDFGIARRLDDGPWTGTVVGTPAYMAPEQIRGRPEPASDLWALGATLFHAVEGAGPFAADGLAALVAAVVTEPVPPAPHAGDHLGPVIEALLVKDPAARPDADGVVRALGGTPDGPPVALPAAPVLPALPALPASPVASEGDIVVANPNTALTTPLPRLAPRPSTLELPPGVLPGPALPVHEATGSRSEAPYAGTAAWPDSPSAADESAPAGESARRRGLLVLVGLAALAAVAVWIVSWATLEFHTVPLGGEAAGIAAQPWESWEMGAAFGAEPDPSRGAVAAADSHDRVLDWMFVAEGLPKDSGLLAVMLAATHLPFLLVLVAARLAFSDRHAETAAALLTGGAAVWLVDGVVIRGTAIPGGADDLHPILDYAPYLAAWAAGMLAALLLLYRVRLKPRPTSTVAALACALLGSASVLVTAPEGPARIMGVALTGVVLLVGGLVRPFRVAAGILGGWALATAGKWSLAAILVASRPGGRDHDEWTDLTALTSEQMAPCLIAAAVASLFAIERALRA